MIEEYLDFRLDLAKYRSLLRGAINAVPFDPSPYLKRFSERGR